jgi:hypothetical protein
LIYYEPTRAAIAVGNPTAGGPMLVVIVAVLLIVSTVREPETP